MRAFSILLVLSLMVSGCTVPTAKEEHSSKVTPEIIPRLSVQPKLDGLISPEEWTEALRIDSSFVIANGGLADGKYPFTLWIGVDDRALHLAVEINEVGPNPFSIAGEEYFPDHLRVFITNAEGPLESPSDLFTVALGREYGSFFDDGYWTGVRWELQGEFSDGSFDDGYPTAGRWALARNTTHTETWEFYIPRTSPLIAYDGLQITGPTEFRIALQFIRQDDSLADPPYTEPRHADNYPGDGPTRTAERDPTSWLRLRTAI